MSLLMPPEQCWLNNNGNILSNGLIYTYVPGTSTPIPTYQDDAETIANQNPVLIDPFGRTLMFGTGNFRFIVKDANGVTIYDQVTASYLESAAISAAMAPVVAAPTLATARTLMGIDTEIQTAIDSISTESITGPPGATGATGPQGQIGPMGPAGPAATTSFDIGAVGTYLSVIKVIPSNGASPVIGSTVTPLVEDSTGNQFVGTWMCCGPTITNPDPINASFTTSTFLRIA